MQVTTLLNAGQNPLAQSIRREVARVITQLELADVTGTPETEFAAFLAHAATVTPGYTNGPIDLTEVVVTNGATLNVENSAGNLDSAGTATVAGGVLTSVKLAATKTIVTHGQTINVENSAGGADSPATAVVANGVISGVNLGALKAIGDNGGSVVMQNSAGASIPGTHTRTVAAGVETNVKLAATVGVVVNAVKQSGWTVTGTGTFFTPTVVNGVCTGGVLSAS